LYLKTNSPKGRADEVTEIETGEVSLSDYQSLLNNLDNMPQLDLFQLRDMVDQLLPAPKLHAMNLEEELVMQYKLTRAVLTEVMAGDEDPNKKATIINSCNASLQNLVKMQSDYYTSERFKSMESHLIRAIQTLPTEAIRTFFEYYENDSSIQKTSPIEEVPENHGSQKEVTQTPK
jgi:hypothetical protein